MAIEELVGSFPVTQTETGGTAVRIFDVDWNTRLSETPQIDEAYPGADFKGLLVVSRAFIPMGGENGKPLSATTYDKAHATINYSTDSFISSRMDIEFSVEAVDTSRGRTYEDVGEVVEDGAAVVYYPIASITLYKRTQDIGDEFNNILQLAGKVNNAKETLNDELSVEVETLLFEGASTKSTVLINGTKQSNVTLKFLYRPLGHNVIYRPARLARDASGNLKYNADGSFKLADGDAGVGAWTRVIPPIYDTADFSSIL